MPRYFFHLRFGRRFLPDDEGIELRNRTAARDEALAVVELGRFNRFLATLPPHDFSLLAPHLRTPRSSGA
jgi:hypothetical protein